MDFTADMLRGFFRGEAQLAPCWKKQYLTELNAFLADVGEDPSAWTEENATSYYKRLCKNRGVRSANDAIRVIDDARKRLAYARVKADDSAFRFTPVRKETDSPEDCPPPWNESATKKVLDTCSERTKLDVRDFALIVTALETGMPHVALTDMRWQKTDDFAEVTLSPYNRATRVALTATARRALNMLRISAGRPESGSVFQIQSAAGVRKIVMRRARLAEVRGTHDQIFRDAFTTWRWVAGVSEFVIAVPRGRYEYGERHFVTTYCHVNDGMIKKFLATTPSWLAEYVETWAEQ